MITQFVDTNAVVIGMGLEGVSSVHLKQNHTELGTIYLLLVSAWFYAELSPLILAPVFFADPAGAVVGKWCSRNVAASLSAGAPQRPRRWAHRRYSNTNCNGSQCIEMQWYTYRFIVLKKVT